MMKNSSASRPPGSGRSSIQSIMRVSRHKTVDVLAGYVRRRSDFENHAGTAFL
jgi:hypothetical protein